RGSLHSHLRMTPGLEPCSHLRVTEYSDSLSLLFDGNARVANELAPFRLFAADAVGKRVGPAGDRFEILRVEKLLPDFGIGENGAHLGVDFRNHLGRQARRPEQAEP